MKYLPAHYLVTALLALSMSICFAQTESVQQKKQCHRQLTEYLNTQSHQYLQKTPFIEQQPPAVIPDLRVSDFTRHFNQHNPAVASTGSGISLVAWKDNRDGRASIYGQLLNNAQLFGVNFKIYESKSEWGSLNTSISID
ncbi:hypothetical protein KAR48_06180, partial [bacterium]|nr:hypothetical protein [bacterium]